MEEHAQWVAAGVIVLAAATFLVRRAMKVSRENRESACSRCSANPQPVLRIDKKPGRGTE